MIWTLIKRHLWHQRKLLMFLLPATVGFQVLIINIGATMDQGPGLTQILEMLPPFIQNMIQTQIGSLSFPAFAAFGFEHPATMGSALAYVVFVCTIPAGERDAGLLDLFLARPLPRHQYLTATLINLLLAAVVLPSCLLLGVVLGLATVSSARETSWTQYAPCSIGLTALILAWGGIALFLATGAQRRGTAIVQLLAAIVTTFLIHVLAVFSSAMVWVSWVSPFSYFHPIRSSIQDRPFAVDVCILLGVFVTTTLLAYRRFQTRDL